MARLADRIWELKWLPPQVLCYRQEFRDPRAAAYAPDRMRAYMEQHRAKLAESAIYAADEIAEYFWKTAEKDRDLKITDFPAVAIPEDRAFIEFRKPTLAGVARREQILANLPAAWGWQMARHTPDEYRAIFNPPELHPHFVAGLSCLLWMTPDDRHLYAPLALAGLQVAADAELLGGVTLGLGFEHDPNRLENPQGFYDYFWSLLFPAVAAMAFLACKSTAVKVWEPEEKLSKARIRRKKRPPVTYRTIECGPIKETLRYQGMAGVQGLAAALRQCRHLFVGDMRGQSTLIALPR